ncbi:MFS transporter [Rhodovibrionaceae bacterium A322]
MSAKPSSGLTLFFSSIGHLYVHLFTAFYFVIALTLEEVWALPYHELIEYWTLGALLVGLAALPAGWIADRWSPTAMMVIYFLGLGASSILCGLIDGPLALMVGLASLGLFASIYHPVGIAWLVSVSKQKGRALGINGVFGAGGVAAAGLVAGGLIDLFSWRMAFILPGVICFATGLLFWWALKRGMIQTQAAGNEPPKAANSRRDLVKAFLILLVTLTVVGILFQATQAALPKVFDLRLQDLAGDGALGVGLLVAAVYTVGGITQVLGGYMADRLPLKKVYVLGFLLQVPALAGVALLGGAPLVVIAATSVLLSTAVLPAENMMLARFTPPQHRSLAYGAKFVLAFGTAPLAIWFVSVVQAQTAEFFWLFAPLAALAAIAAIAAFFLPEVEEEVAPSAQPQAAE